MEFCNHEVLCEFEKVRVVVPLKGDCKHCGKRIHAVNAFKARFLQTLTDVTTIVLICISRSIFADGIGDAGGFLCYALYFVLSLFPLLVTRAVIISVIIPKSLIWIADNTEE